MLSLRSAAARFQYDVFHPWDMSTETFDTSVSAEILGRLFRIDRFTTIYHRPTRRRQITLPPNTQLPASLVMKHAMTGEIFILSETLRKDATARDVYDQVAFGHLAMSPSGGLGTLYRPTLQGLPNDPGPADLLDVAQVYVDVELRTVQETEGTEEQPVALSLLTFPAAVELHDDDWLLLSGSRYKIVEPYVDGGFLSARAVKEPYDLSTITYYYDTGAGGGYDPITGTVTQTVTEAKQISAIVVLRQETASATTASEAWSGTAYIPTNLITWNPVINHSLDYAGIRYKIMSTRINKRGTQWELKLKQWQGYLPPAPGAS